MVHVGRRPGSLVQLPTVKPCDLPEIKTPYRLTRRAALKGMRDFLTRAGVWGLEITTRKAAEGTRAHFCGQLSYLKMLRTAARTEKKAARGVLVCSRCAARRGAVLRTLRGGANESPRGTGRFLGCQVEKNNWISRRLCLIPFKLLMIFPSIQPTDRNCA